MTEEKTQGLFVKARTSYWTYVVLTVFSALLFYARAYVGWVPWDAGTMGHIAQRVLLGQIPHVDFIDTHTGGLSYFHAGIARLRGLSLASLREALAIVWLITLIPLISILNRLLAMPRALVFFAIAISLSIAVHLYPLPSWYNTIAAVWAIFLVLRFIDKAKLKILYWAGFLTGLSFLSKLSGLYLLAALLLFCLYYEQSQINESKHSIYFRSLIISGLFMLLFLVLLLIGPGFGATVFMVYFLPCSFAILLLLEREVAKKDGNFKQRLKTLSKLCLTVVFGFLTPILVFLLVTYPSAELLWAWFRGVFIVPQYRLDYAKWVGVSPIYVITVSFLFMILCFIKSKLSSLSIRIAFALVWTGFLVIQPLTGAIPTLALWMMLYVAHALSAITAFCLISRNQNKFSKHKEGSKDSKADSQLFLIAVVLSFHALIQYPYFNSGYLIYVIPVGVLLLAALSQYAGGAIKQVVILTLLGLVPLGVDLVIKRGLVVPGVIETGDNTELLNLERAMIYVHPNTVTKYSKMYTAVIDHYQGKPIYAGPDCPEVFYLTGAANPTKSLYEFFEAVALDQREEEFFTMIEEHEMKVIVVNRFPGFSKPISSSMNQRILELFPYSETNARYEVRWRE